MQSMHCKINYKLSQSILIILTISAVLSKQQHETYAAETLKVEGSGSNSINANNGVATSTNANNSPSSNNLAMQSLALIDERMNNETSETAEHNNNQQSTRKPMPARLPPPPEVKLNKCCRIGEYLSADQACVAGTSENWVPFIYLLNRKVGFSPRGASPKFIKFEENVRPEIPHRNKQTTLTTAERCSADELELFTGSFNNIVIFSNGSLLIRERFITVEPPSYCVDRDSALVCFPKEQADGSASPQLKFKKCCSKHGSYDPDSKTCFLNARHDGSLKLPINESSYQTHYGFPKCPNSSTSYVIAGDWLTSKIHNETGHLSLPHVNLTYMDYCLEHLRDEVMANSSDLPSAKIIVCSQHFNTNLQPDNMDAQFNRGTGADRLQIAVLNIGIVISIVFLGATLVAGYLMPSVHHVLHWRCQIYYVLCLFIGDALLAYSQLSSSLELDSTLCLVVASTMHFFFLSAFFWLNTMCFNIWWTFRDFRPSSLERNQEILRLRLYSAYAWGIPLVISATAAIIDSLPETQLLRPGFGERGCWFNGASLSIFAYFFGPVGILLVVNIILFILTTHQLTCGLWKRDDVKSTTEKTALGKVCLKLVVVMGVTWIADVLSWVIGGPHSAWFLTDLINALQGVFIFIVIGCQPQVWTACKRFCCPRSRQEITNTTNGVQHSSSSHGLPSLAACGGETTQNTSIANNTTNHNGTLNVTQTKIPMETVC